MENRETVSTLSAEPRRYVGKKETLAYVLNDVAASLNINDFKERYIYDVVKIDFKYLCRAFGGCNTFAAHVVRAEGKRGRGDDCHADG